MIIALSVAAGLLGLAAGGSGLAKISRRPAIIETLAHVGVKPSQVPLLGVLEVLGALGLLAGIWSKPLGVAAALGLALYFLGAVISHLRVKDEIAEFAPALVIYLVALFCVVLEFKR